MTPPNGTTTGEHAGKWLSVEAEAAELARGQRELTRAGRSLRVHIDPSSTRRALEVAYEHLAATPPADAESPKAAEWFLDNYYLIRRIVRQIEEDLPSGFVRRLPELATGTVKGRLRSEVIAESLVAVHELEIDLAGCRRFIDAYQQVASLTIAELWALPTLLRSCVLRHLASYLEDLEALGLATPAPEAGRPPGREPMRALTPPIDLDPTTGVQRSIHALRMLDAIDWKAFFQKTNRVEAILLSDPAGLYGRMDFETCDAYRKAVEEIAWQTGRDEQDVAALAIELASEHPTDERRGHVGHHLMDEGRLALEARVGFRARGMERIRRSFTAYPTVVFLLPVALLTTIPLLVVGTWLSRAGMPVLSAVVAMTIALVPTSAVAVSLLQWALSALLPPRIRPKLDLSRGIPREAKTLVVVPTLLGREEDILEMTRRLELHHLSNPDPQLQFALLTDDLDTKAAQRNETLLLDASQRIAALNAKHGTDGHGPFHLLHRELRWNPSEGLFMGWERKRGKLEELNRLLRGDTQTSYAVHVGEPEGLRDVRFVITLDSDTQLPMGSAHRMIGLLAHPLNRALFDPETGRVVAGYTIVQPRIETSPSSSRTTRFARIFSGDVGFDIYTHAVSDLYQDLFGAGIYVGKGIYDVDAFVQSVKGRVPENALVSHDLFEGIHGRTALASDITLFEDFPSTYAAHAKRIHRWVRGDWQLLPWLFPRVPSASGERMENTLRAVDRWKILDNLRRSLTNPSLFLLLLSGWTWLPGNPLHWTLGALALLLAPMVQSIVVGRRRRSAMLGRAALAVVFLAFEAWLALDAVVRVFVRRKITHKLLLQWTSAAHAELGIAAKSPRTLAWRMMIISPSFAIWSGCVVAWLRPEALASAAPVLLLWCIAPEVARWVSQPEVARTAPLQPDERRRLRLLAGRTWHFFDAFVGPNDQWLPIDNYQEPPHEQLAHRTSPTNIGLMLLSTLSAYDLGYVGPSELSLRLRRAFDSIVRLSHYRGHLLNWYDTKNLQPLSPHYVSTVDSGNFAGCLVALEQGCREVARAPVVRRASWDGLRDALGMLEEGVESIRLRDGSRPRVASLLAVIERMVRESADGHEEPSAAYRALHVLCGDRSAELDRELLRFVDTEARRCEVEALQALRTASDRVHRQLQQMRRELDTYMPWLALQNEAAACAIELPDQVRYDEIPAVAQRLRTQLYEWELARRRHGALSPELASCANRLSLALRSAEEEAVALRTELHALAALAAEEVRHMDFQLLYDRERKLFHIGYDATQDRVDPHYYDLLASEARLASYLAIVKGDVPEAHWYALGRPMTEVGGAPALLSWGGTMFEYLMPTLLMRSQPGTLLAQTCQLAVACQMAYARGPREPWGISEAAYARFDAHHTYQYRSFGVPGLGFKRGLEDERVIAPYASMLAVGTHPREVVDNLDRLEAMGMLGRFGLFEAADFTAERVPDGRSFAVVRSYMAHHQGMSLIALGNMLTERSMVDRFHADSAIETGELLLNEQAPSRAPREWPVKKSDEAALAPMSAAGPRAPEPWVVSELTSPQAFVLGNGRLTSLLTASGGGGLMWQGLALTRYQPDPTHDEDGLWLYVRDRDSGRVWLATSSEGRTSMSMEKVDFHLRREGISIHVEVSVAAADDVEARQITLHNESGRPRRFTVVTAGRPVLFNASNAPTHPAFSSMFVESEHIAEIDGLCFTRRPQSEEENRAVVVHRLVREGAAVRSSGYETDRAAFYGRGASVEAPAALTAPAGRQLGRTGTVLDPLMSLSAAVELKAEGSVALAFVTTVGRTRGEAVELARKYGTMHSVRWLFRDARQESSRRLQRTKVDPARVREIQRLFSAYHYADAGMRAPREVLLTGMPSQRRLWGHGISGDDPIVLVRVYDPEAPLLPEILAAQRYLRACNQRFDLVLVDEQASGYATGGPETVRGVLARHEADAWINQRGGVYLIPADQADQEARLHLEASARVVLDTRRDSLASQLQAASAPPPPLPRFERSLPDETSQRSRPRPALLLDNGIGGFSEDGREYVLSVSDGKAPPAPWCNVLANAEFGCLVSESSFGTTWSLNSGENRLTPWRNDAVLDTPSEVLYLRDEETAAVWSTTPLPAGRRGEVLVRHGAGYTIYEREDHGLEQIVMVFVPPDAGVKIVRLKVRNTLGRHRRLTATYYAEWVLGTRRERQRPYLVSEIDDDRACLLASCSWNSEFAGRVAFLASRLKAHNFTTDRTEFLGRRGDYARPEALERWGLTGRLDPGVDPCAALQIHLDLAPGEEFDTHFVLGQAESREAALDLALRFRRSAEVDASWEALHAFWDGVLGTVRVATPEPSMDLMLNRWLLYQSLSARVFGRTGFYQSSGAFGYRDQLQDVLALLHAAPERARAHLLESARHQFEEGDVLHWWHPPSGRGVRTRCSDDLAWLPFVTAEYVLATGDTEVLAETAPFLTGAPLGPDEGDRYAEYETSSASGTLLEHCRRALEKSLSVGAHGLPLMGTGDWNDGMNRVGALGRGESVWLGFFLCATMQRFAALHLLLDNPIEAARWQERGRGLREQLEAVAWDGGWYLRAFHDDGSVVGSAKSRECRIDSIAQSWSVLAHGPGNGIPLEANSRERLAIRAADSQLVRAAERLVLLFWPPFDSTIHDPGYVRAYPPGVRENGGQYTHAATWLGWAHARLGDGEKAERLFRLLNPALRTRAVRDVERYRVEPYVLAADVYSCSPWVGRGGWTWYTGAAAWMWRLGVEAILGLRRESGRLRVEPCIPPAWPGYEAWVVVGRQRVHLTVENPDHVATGVARLMLDGVEQSSSLLDLDPSVEGMHEVDVRLGTARALPASDAGAS